MRGTMPHLVLYDNMCAFCNRSVNFLLKADHHHAFLFAPLEGETASKFTLKNPKNDSLVLIEHYKTLKEKQHYYGSAVLRICWHLGGLWRLLGVFSFLPTFLVDFIYRIISRHRHIFGQKGPPLVIEHDPRLLP
jgi:predicted DCC family thiol-disulfide oxidoreductase YuxK